jgi:hypothetical protein
MLRAFWGLLKLGAVSYYHAAHEEIERSREGKPPRYGLPFFPYRRYFSETQVQEMERRWQEKMEREERDRLC